MNGKKKGDVIETRKREPGGGTSGAGTDGF